MSGGLSFISTNPGIDGFDRGQESISRQREREFRDRQREQERAVDAAIRGGLSDISTAAPTAMQSAVPRPTGGNPNPPMQIGDRDSFRRSLASIEDPTGRAINPSGHIGRYQFSTGALHSAGVYQPAPGENLRSNQWRGTIVLPGGRRMTRDQFLQDPNAQEEAFTAHTSNLDREIAARGLDRYIGTRVMDQPITRAALYSMMHLGGPEGTAKFLRSGGVYDPADANGMRISTYSQELLKRMGADGAGGSGAGGAPSVASPVGGRYDPIVSRLAAVPGGGRPALDLIGRGVTDARYDQNRQDQIFDRDRNFQQRQTETAQARNDRFQMMAMQAFARGDADVGHYWAKQGGFQIPDELAKNPQQLKMAGTATTMARGIYGDDRAGAARFVREFMTRGGDVAAALDAAGDPAGGGRGSIQWRDDGTGRAVGVLVDPRTGVSRPITDIDGNPVIRAPGQGQQAREADRVVRLRMLRAAGFSDQEANAIAAGATASPNAMAASYGRVARLVADDFTIKTEADRQARIAQTMEAMFGPGWQQKMQGQPAPAAAPAAPVEGGGRPVIQKQRPVGVPAGSQWNEQRKLWRDSTGRIYDQNGVPVR